MAKTKEIQQRIKSIGNTKKITKAMQMVSAAKMRKAVEAVLRTRTYANLSWATVLNLARTIGAKDGQMHPMFHEKEVFNRVGLILISSNRGLCGGFNTAIINKANESIQKHLVNKDGKTPIEHDIILLGKKGEAIYRYHGHKVAADFAKEDVVTKIKEIIPLATMITDGYLKGKYDKIVVAYTDYISASKQLTRVKQLLPIDLVAEDAYLGIVGQDTRIGTDKSFIDSKQEKHLQSGKYTYEYIFEPSPEQVLDEILPRVVEIQLFQALLESNASEHSARMAAMQQATDAAGDLVDELVLNFNKARQSAITSELAEISAGVNALKKR